MAPVVPLAAPPTLDAHNTFLRDHPLNAANNNSSNNSNNINNNIKQQQVPCQNGEIKQVQQQHSEQEGLSSTAAVAPEQIVVDERENKDLNDSLFSGRGGTRASLGITTTNHEFNGRRTVRWSDTHGVDLVQIWEFQPRGPGIYGHFGNSTYSLHQQDFDILHGGHKNDMLTAVGAAEIE